MTRNEDTAERKDSGVVRQPMMSPGRNALLGVLLVAFAFIGILWNSAEPVQDGKPISFWISNMATGGSGSKAVLDKMDPAETIPYLVRTVRGERQPTNRWERIYARINPRLPAFLRQKLPAPTFTGFRAMMEENYAMLVQRRAADYLAHIGTEYPSTASAVVPELIPLLSHPDGNTRFCAADALIGYGTNAAPAIPVLENLLTHEPEKVHDVMLKLLEKCGPQAKSAVPVLVRSLDTTNEYLRVSCARTLWRLDPSRADSVRSIAMKLAHAKDAGVRIETASLLWNMDRDTANVVPILIGLLEEDDHPFDYRTILMLKEIGTGAAAAIPALKVRLIRVKKVEPFVRKAAEEALTAMAGEISTNPTMVPSTVTSP